MYDLEEVLELHSLEELLEICDITSVKVLEILLAGGHIELPPYLIKEYIEEDEGFSTEE